MKIVVVLSGGLDSTVLLHHHIAKQDQVRAVTINYGQRHVYEVGYAAKTCRALKIEHQVAELGQLRELLPGSSQTDSKVSVPHGKYDEEVMKKTVVPNRNMILLSIAIGVAVSHKCEAVSYAAHAGDHAIYPDCRPAFVEALEHASLLCDWQPVSIIRPFINFTKALIVARGQELGVDFASTYSCYEGGAKHCGRCGTCVERFLAFKESGVPDPTPYQDSKYALQFT